MKIQRDYVLSYLKDIQQKDGGYFGTDVADLAKRLCVTRFGLQKRISSWKKNDAAFKGLVYLGRNRPSVTLNEFIEIKSRLSSNPLVVKQHILSDLQKERKKDTKEIIPKTTFYRVTEQMTLSQFYSDFIYPWFASNKIMMSGEYSLKKARESLSTIFTFSDMKNPTGPDIREIYIKFSKAKEWFSMYNVEAIDHYPKILTEGKRIRSILASIPPDQQEEVQARLIFEAHTAFIVECFDLLIETLIRKNGRIQQKINKDRPNVENRIRENVISSLRKNLNDIILKSSFDRGILYNLLNPAVGEKTKADITLLREHSNDYHSILHVLDDLTNGMIEGINFHSVDAHRIFLLAKDKNKWKLWGEKEKRSFIRNPDLVMAINNGNEDVASLIAIRRIMTYIKQGKITFRSSYYYQDISNKMKNIEADGNDFLTIEILEKLVSKKFVIDIQNWVEELNGNKTKDIDPDEDDVPYSWTNLSDVLKEVLRYVRAMIPEWFEEHKKLFRKQTDGLFSMEYTEEEFADRLYKSIGFLGRNFRYRDSEDFLNLKYFIQRYVTEEQLILELKFIHRCMAFLRSNGASIFVVDTMGINSRKKSILSDYHGRYNTIGFSDMRSVTPDMIPIISFRCRSTDSEAMNMVSAINMIQTVCDNNMKVYTGDAHTVSRISAGMIYLAYGVVAAGRICHKPKDDLGEHKINKLRANIPLLKKVGKLLRNNPSLGRAMAMKKYIYIDGINVCKLVEDLGYLILQNVSNAGIPVDNICLAVERSNHLKKKTRIVEGSYTRQRMNGVGLSLLSGELILCMAGIYHTMNGWTGPVSPINFSDIRIVTPA